MKCRVKYICISSWLLCLNMWLAIDDEPVFLVCYRNTVRAMGVPFHSVLATMRLQRGFAPEELSPRVTIWYTFLYQNNIGFILPFHQCSGPVICYIYPYPFVMFIQQMTLSKAEWDVACMFQFCQSIYLHEELELEWMVIAWDPIRIEWIVASPV